METLKSSETPQMSETPELPKIHEIFSKLFFGLKRFVHFRVNSHNMIVSMTIMLSYFVDLLETLAYIHFQGPEGSGKTVGLQIIGLSGFNPFCVTGPSDAVLYRILHQGKRLLIWDEAEILETASTGSRIVFQVLRTGYKRGGSVPRCDKKDPYGIINYGTYGIKVTANINGIQDPALKSRYIIITMSEPNPDQQLEIFYPNSEDGNLFREIGKDLLLLSQNNHDLGNSLRDHCLNLKKDDRLKGITGRFFEIFSSYFALAKVIGEGLGRDFLFQAVLRFATKYIEARKEEHSFTDRPTMITYFVWTYVKPLLDFQHFVETQLFWASKMCTHVRDELKKRFDKTDSLTVNELTKILTSRGILLGGKVKRVNKDEDSVERNTSAWHYLLDVERLRTLAEGSLKKYYEDADLDKPADRGDL
jgi:hypothetical protein